jgi:hypothetical protein
MNNEIKVVYGDVKREAVLIDPSIPVALSGSNEGTENNQSNIIAEGTSTRELLNKNMADNHDRVIPLDDALLLTMVGEKAELVEKGRGISKQFEEMQAQLERLHMDLTAVTADVTTKKLAILKRVEQLAKDKLTEFEIPVTTEIRKGKVVLIATDALAEFTDSFKRFDKFEEPVPRKEKKNT